MQATQWTVDKARHRKTLLNISSLMHTAAPVADNPIQCSV